MPSKDKVAITVRLEPKLAKRIKKLAKKAGRSTSSMIAWILEDRIHDEERMIDKILEGRSDMKAGRYMDLDEAFQRVERKIEEASKGRAKRKRSA